MEDALVSQRFEFSMMMLYGRQEMMRAPPGHYWTAARPSRKEMETHESGNLLLSGMDLTEERDSSDQEQVANAISASLAQRDLNAWTRETRERHRRNLENRGEGSSRLPEISSEEEVGEGNREGVSKGKGKALARK